MADKTGKPPLLEESQIAERAKKFLIMGARREGGQLAYISASDDQAYADAAAAVLTATGWATVEVYTRVSVHTRK